MKETIKLTCTIAFIKALPFFILFFVLGVVSQAQSKAITGKVVDALSQPVAGVSVNIKGTSNRGTATDDKGYFSISASPADMLSFSYGSLERKAGSDNNFTISLANSFTSMNEVVVIGYGTTQRKNLTTAVVKIDPKAVPQAANNSVAQLVFGRAAGEQAVQQSPEPGGAINIAIRGRGNPGYRSVERKSDSRPLFRC